MKKTCTCCNKEFPATAEYYNKSKRCKDGLHTNCRECCKIYRKEYLSTYKYKKRRIGEKKKCTTCNEEFPATTEHYNKAKGFKDGLHTKCKGCIKIYNKKYHSTDKYKNKCREKMDIKAKWRKENPEEAKKAEREKYKRRKKMHPPTEESRKISREASAKWRKENPEKYIESSRRSDEKRRNDKEYMIKRNALQRWRYKNDPEYRQMKIEVERKYVASGRRLEMNRKPENRKKGRLRSSIRHANKELRERDYRRGKKYRELNKGVIRKRSNANVKNIVPSYAAGIMKMSVRDLSPEIYETKKLILQLKRELKKEMDK